MAIYKVIMKGSAHGQAILNTLFYRTGVGIDVDGLTVGGADTLAGLVKNTVWAKWKVVVPGSYTLQQIIVYPFRDGTFDLMYQNPFTLDVLETGLTPEQADGTAPCAIIKFNLEPTAILPNGPKPPKRGYVAVGPLTSNNLDDAGRLVAGIFTNPLSDMKQLASALSENLESLVPPVIFYPVRVRQEKILGILKITSFADVSSASIRQLSSFRRSRMLEA